MKRLSIVIAAISGFTACTGSREVKPPKENIYRVAVASKFTTLDPHFTTDVYSMAVQGLAIENLYEFHYLKRPMQLTPLIAESLPKITNDSKTFTFKLKKGIHFQDHPCFKSTNGKGPEITAEDFSYSIHRISSPKKVSPNYSNFEGLVEGIDAYHKGKAPAISGVKVLDKYTLQINLVRSSPRFAYTFSDSRTGPLPKECVDNLGDDLAHNLVGTGPYKLVEYDPASKAVAVKNPNYKTMKYPTEGMEGDQEKGLLADAGKSLPFIDKIVVDVLVEQQPRWLKFVSGEHEQVGIPKDNVGTALPNGKLSQDLVDKGIRHIREVQADVTTWIFNTETPVWGEKKELRQAFKLALNIPEWITLIYANQAIPAQSLIDPTMYGYDPAFKSKWADFSVEKAKALLAKAGYPEGKGLPVLEMPMSSSTVSRQMAELIERQMRVVGIPIKVQFMTWPELSKGLREKKWMVTPIGYAGSMPDVDGVLPHFHSKNTAPGPNVANYKNKEVDRLINEIEGMRNSPERLKKITQVRDLIDEDLPYIPGVHRIGNQLIHRWVKNFVYTDDALTGAWIKFKKVEVASGDKK